MRLPARSFSVTLALTVSMAGRFRNRADRCVLEARTWEGEAGELSLTPKRSHKDPYRRSLAVSNRSMQHDRVRRSTGFRLKSRPGSEQVHGRHQRRHPIRLSCLRTVERRLGLCMSVEMCLCPFGELRSEGLAPQPESERVRARRVCPCMNSNFLGRPRKLLRDSRQLPIPCNIEGCSPGPRTPLC